MANLPMREIHTLVALIPKEEGILHPDRFRGIACVPFLYKLKRTIVEKNKIFFLNKIKTKYI